MKSNKISALMAGLLTLVVIAPTFAAGASPRVYATAIRTGEKLTYDILQDFAPASYNTLQYWDPSWAYKGNITVEAGGKIEVTVNGTHEVGGTPDAYLDVKVKYKSGALNWSILNETNSNLGYVFTLGSNPDNLGFIAQVNWTEWNRSLFANFGVQLTKFERSPTLITINLNCTDPMLGYQNSTLIYDLTTGVLKYGFSESSFGGKIVLQLASSTIPLPSDAVIPGFPMEMLALAILAGGIFVVMARKHTKLAPRHL